MNGLDLFSGIGGIAEALSPWVETVAYCENDRYAQAVLLSRMSKGEIDTAPIWDDVRTLKGKDLPRIDIITAGVPCQDISIAGRRAGLAGKRSGLFSEVFRLLSEIRPQFLFLENVPNITLEGGVRITAEIAGMFYDERGIVIPAGWPFKDANRWWLLAKTNGANEPRGSIASYEKKATRGGNGGLCAPCLRERESEPVLCGMGYGIWDTNYRLKALGQGVVQVQAREAFKRLMGL